MDKCSNSIFDECYPAGWEQILNEVTRQTGRKPNSLEKNIISRLFNHDIYRLNHRFTIDESHRMLADETDRQAGIVVLNDDYACAFKAEPVYATAADELAAKVVAAGGKMYRDVWECGSRSWATLLLLSSGLPTDESAKMDLQHGITDMSAYSNTAGIPVVGGNVQFNPSGNRSIIANLLTVGLIDTETRIVSACQGIDNPVYLIDMPDVAEGIASSAFATRSLYELIDDLRNEGAIVAVRNIDDGGIACACAEMIANGTHGIELHTEPLGKETEPTELLPDSVVMILEKDCRELLEKACRKWNIRSRQVGIVIADHKLMIVKGRSAVTNLSGSETADEVIADLPATILLSMFSDVPDEKVIEPVAGTVQTTPAEVPIPQEHKDVAKFLVTCPNLLSQQWLFEQFDSTTGNNNLSTNFVSDAPVLRIKGTPHALAVSFRQTANDLSKYPEAANLAIAEAVRNVVCAGGDPYAITGCLHYGSAVEPQTLQQINAYIESFCKKTGISSSGISMSKVPSDGEPSITHLSAGAVAFLNDKGRHMTISFKEKGDMIYLLGKSYDSLDDSEYIHNYHHIHNTPPQRIDLDVEAELLRVTQKIIDGKLINSAHGISKGGLFMALLESAMVNSYGFDVTVDDEIRKDAFLFGESPSRIIVTVATKLEADFIDFMMETQVPFLTLGHTTREEIRIDDNSYGFISDYRKQYFGKP